MNKHINCFIFAFRLWRKRGGYLIIRWSRSLKGIPHFLWCPDGALDGVQKIRHYAPLKPTKHPWQFWKSFSFDGRVKYCDRSPCPTNNELCQKCQWRKADAENTQKSDD